MTRRRNQQYIRFMILQKAEQISLISEWDCTHAAPRAGAVHAVSAFSYILDMCRVNATTIYALNKNIDPKKFIICCDGGRWWDCTLR